MYHQIDLNRRRSVIIVVLFVLVWCALGYIAGFIAGGKAGGVAGVGIGLLLALAVVVYSLVLGKTTVLAISGARPADPAQYAQLHNLIESIAIGAGLPKPEVYIIDDPTPNAFATGLSPKASAVTVTTGLLQMMNREELEGVLGHEMSHIRNHDVRVVLIVATMVGLAALLASLLWRGMFSLRRMDERAAVVLIVAGLLMAVVGLIVGPLMQLALSRSRESLADASCVELTRNPAGLLQALQKIAQNDKPLAKFNHTTAAMFIDNPLEHHKHWLHNLFDTHPPIEERIAALQAIIGVQQT
ncbi:MAG: M48 family metallopeptidase [Candidatus Dormibacteria bacterium]